MAGKPGKFNLKRPSRDGRKHKSPFGWKRPSRTVAFWVILFLLAIIGVRFMEEWDSLKERPISYSQFQAILREPDIQIAHAFIVMTDRSVEFHGTVGKKSSRLSLTTCLTGSKYWSLSI